MEDRSTASAYRRLVIATGIPGIVLARLEIDPLATPKSTAAIVREYVGRTILRTGLDAPTLPARAAVLLPVIARRIAAEEAA